MEKEIELKILHKYLAGNSQKAIANNLSMPRSTVYSILRRYRTNSKYKEQLLAKKRGRPKTIDETIELKIVELRNKGYYEQEIAHEVGLSRTGIHAVLNRNSTKVNNSKAYSRRIIENLKRLNAGNKGKIHFRKYDYDLIRRLKSYGESYRAVARTVGSSKGLVWYALKVEKTENKEDD